MKAPEKLIRYKMKDGDIYCSIGYLANELGLLENNVTKTMISLVHKLRVPFVDLERLMWYNDYARTNRRRIQYFKLWCKKHRIKLI